MTATGKSGYTDETVVIIWDGLHEEERECNELDDNVKILGTLETTRSRRERLRKGPKRIVERRTREPTESQKVNIGEKH